MLPLRPGAPGAVRPRAGVPARRRRLEWGDGIPHRDGRLDVHDDRHDDTGRRSPASTRPSATATRASWSTRTCCSACRPTTSRRSRCARAARPHRRSCATCCSTPTRSPPRLRPVRRGRPLGPRQPPGLGDLRERAARHGVARVDRRLVRADGGRAADIARWYAASMARPTDRRSADRDGRSRRRRGRPRAGSGSAARLLAGAPRRRRRRASSSSSSATTAARRTTTRGSSGARTTRPATSSSTGAAYDAWATVERESGEPIVTRTGGIDLFPAGGGDRPIDVHVEPRRRRRAVRVARRRRGRAAAGRRSRPATSLDDAVMAIHRRHRHRAGRAGDGDAAALARRARRRAAPATRRCVDRGRSAARSTSSPTPGAVRCGSVIVAADAWTNALLAPLGHRAAARRAARAGDVLHATADLAPFAPGGSRCGSGWTTRASTASRCTATRGR